MDNSRIDIETIDYYDDNASDFIAGTVSADMSEALGRFMALLPKGGCVLDWGCGSGRDSRSLLECGFQVMATDASAEMCKAASSLSGVDVRNEGFLDLKDKAVYDGIWACASLLHLRRDDLPKAFACANSALNPNGVLYASFKLGKFEGKRNGRWFTDLSEGDLSTLLSAESWSILEIWRSGDVREEREGELWLNFLARKA